jgi:hypothetical protein
MTSFKATRSCKWAWRGLRLAGSGSQDEAAQFVWLLTAGSRSHLVPEDLVPLIQDVVDTHPGLLFLKEATEFHSRYVHTVSIAIETLKRSWKERRYVSVIGRRPKERSSRESDQWTDLKR